MARLYALMFVIGLVLAVIALISVLSAEEGELRALPRIAWVLIILFFPLLGSIAYFAAGRPVKAKPSTGWRVGGGFPEPPRTSRPAPDDDPEFLRSLDNEQSRKDRELLNKWEEDLRRREDELRRKESDEDRPEG